MEAARQFLSGGGGKAAPLPAGKLLLGVPAYGRALANPGDVKTYEEIAGLAGLEQVGSSKQALKALRSLDDAAGYGFNSVRTVKRKAKWAKKQGLAGVMVWEVGQDAKGGASLLVQLHRQRLQFAKPKGGEAAAGEL